LDLKGVRVSGGERPQVTGQVKMRNVQVEAILPPALRSFIEGSLSGEFRVFGSTNSSDGVGYEGKVSLDGGDVLSLRERIHILKALSVVDYSRNYHRVDFREGSFQMKTFRGGMELSGVNLKADDLFSMEGRMTVRQPTPEETQEAVAKSGTAEGSPVFEAGDVPQKGVGDFSMNRVELESRRIQDGKQSPESLGLFDRMGLGVEMRRMQEQASERMSRMLRYEGMFLISLPGDAFERAPRLQELYPADSATGRVPMRVPIEGHLYELTLKQAEDIYERGQR
jgi:hypothetical protein